ncbi:MAG: hypothetical protein H7644_02300 [Candidatus Heimdallarchaeota archaeon]|nr:hypothetical protein [Candidatus Heimdallarchaeota archaeon]MCK5142576.1 hypothetical protein [Candidatus Heimdallarchaeota archaeon]
MVSLSLLLQTNPSLADETTYNISIRVKERSLGPVRNEIFDERTRRYFQLSEKGELFLEAMLKYWNQVAISFNESQEISKN